MASSTDNLGFKRPEVDSEADADVWGSMLNENWSRADAYLHEVGQLLLRQRLISEATIHLDFVRGRYLVDDGQCVETNNAADVMTVERSSPKWVFGSNGKLQEVPAGTLARHWDPLTGKPLGVLIENSATNFSPHSNPINGWSVMRSEISSVSVDNPLGLQQVAQIESTVEGAFYLYKDYSLKPATMYVKSCVFKPGSGSAGIFRLFFHQRQFGQRGSVDFNVSDATVTSNFLDSTRYGVISLGGGWYRIWGAATTSEESVESGFEDIIWPVDAIGSIYYIAHYQTEEGVYPSSIIFTNGYSSTRSADNVYRDFGAEFNRTHGTYVFIGNTYSLTSVTGGIVGNKSSSTGSFAIYKFSPDVVRSYDGSEAYGQFRPGNSEFKYALAMTPDRRLAAADGKSFGDGPHNGRLLNESSLKILHAGGACKTLVYIPRALSASELEAITS